MKKNQEKKRQSSKCREQCRQIEQIVEFSDFACASILFVFVNKCTPRHDVTSVAVVVVLFLVPYTVYYSC